MKAMSAYRDIQKAFDKVAFQLQMYTHMPLIRL